MVIQKKSLKRRNSLKLKKSKRRNTLKRRNSLKLKKSKRRNTLKRRKMGGRPEKDQNAIDFFGIQTYKELETRYGENTYTLEMGPDEQWPTHYIPKSIEDIKAGSGPFRTARDSKLAIWSKNKQDEAPKGNIYLLFVMAKPRKGISQVHRNFAFGFRVRDLRISTGWMGYKYLDPWPGSLYGPEIIQGLGFTTAVQDTAGRCKNILDTFYRQCLSFNDIYQGFRTNINKWNAEKGNVIYLQNQEVYTEEQVTATHAAFEKDPYVTGDVSTSGFTRHGWDPDSSKWGKNLKGPRKVFPVKIWSVASWPDDYNYFDMIGLKQPTELEMQDPQQILEKVKTQIINLLENDPELNGPNANRAGQEVLSSMLQALDFNYGRLQTPRGKVKALLKDRDKALGWDS